MNEGPFQPTCPICLTMDLVINTSRCHDFDRPGEHSARCPRCNRFYVVYCGKDHTRYFLSSSNAAEDKGK